MLCARPDSRSVIRLALALALVAFLCSDAAWAQQAIDAHYDFRNKAPLPEGLKLIVPDVNEVVTVEDAGLRFTLPATRREGHPVGVATTYALAGDFEVIGTYEMLSVERAPTGYGVG